MGQDRTLGMLLGAALLFALGYTSAIVVIPLMAAAFKSPAIELGIVVGLPGLLGFVLAIPSAALSNHFGRRTLIVAGFACQALATTGYMLAPSLLWTIPSQVGLGLGMILFWPSALAAFSEIVGRRSHEFIQGANALVQGLASFGGAVLAAFVINFAGIGPALGIQLLVATAGLGVALAIPETAPRGLSTGIAFGPTLKIAGRVLSDRYVALGVASLLSWSMLWWVAGASFFIVHVHEAGFSPAFAGVLLGIRIGLASLLRLKFRSIAQVLDLRRVLVWGNPVAAIGLALAVVLPTGLGLAISAGLQGLGLALVLPASNVVVSRGTSATDRAVGLAMSASANNLAILVSGPLLGAIASLGGSGAALMAAAIAAIAVSTWTAPWRHALPTKGRSV